MSSAAVIETLEALIAPGKRARVSPYVELAQIGVLFDISAALVPVVATERDEFLRTRSADIAAVACTWEQFKHRGAGITIPDYGSADFRRAYRAYYTTLNVPKVQLVLLDLLRQQALPPTLDVVDIGVGAGTTIVAVLDFLLALSEACALHGVACPVTEMRVTGFDRDPNLLAMSRSRSRPPPGLPLWPAGTAMALGLVRAMAPVTATATGPTVARPSPPGCNV